MSETSEEIKCVFLGDSGVGKTSILINFMNGKLTKNTSPTIGAAYVSKTIKVLDKLCDLMIWDTAGQEIYRGLAPMYYRNAMITFIVFDVTSQKSFKAVNFWANELSSNDVYESSVIIVVGNKIDKAERKVDLEQAEEVAKSIGAKYIETSAVTGHNIERLFQVSVSEALNRKNEHNIPEANDSIDLTGKKDEKKSCC